MNHDDRSYRAAAREAMEARFARSVAACLSESAEQVSPDVAERLRFGREKALEIARHGRGNAHELGVTASGAAIAGFSQSRWWLRFASVLPLVALVGGLVLIQNWENRAQISVAAEIDEALLGDDLPINAYRDPGFSEFLKAPPSE
ncbi:MAG TPA: DUF3619 family protein [Caldimonas sp.]